MNDLQVQLTKALPRIANRLRNELVLTAPVDTGRLRSSIKVGFNGNDLIITMVEYGQFIEFGCFFDKDTKIKIKNGFKKIKSLIVGEEVWTGKQYKKVIQKEKMEIGYDLKKITIKTKNRKLEVTEDHPIYTDKGWKKAIDLKKGDIINAI